MTADTARRQTPEPALLDTESAQPYWNLRPIVAELRLSREVMHNIRHGGRIRALPSREALAGIAEGLASALFPTHRGRPDLTEESIDYFVGDTLNTSLNALAEQVRRGLLFVSQGKEEDDAHVRRTARQITEKFAASLPAIRALLVSDLKAAFDGDPAATSIPEILLGYPGMSAIISHRLAHALFEFGAALPARIISDNARSTTGIDIHPAAKIGGSFFIDHGTGVVIGETAIVGERVRLYQAVTLGAKSFPRNGDGTPAKGYARHPIVEDDVVIHAGATILGRVIIGKGSTIGGNVWLTQSVPPGSNVTQARTNKD
jgi:serine O-acetyltransferase